MKPHYTQTPEKMSLDSMNYFHESIGEKIKIDEKNFLYKTNVAAPQFNFFYIESVEDVDIAKSLDLVDKIFKEKRIIYNVIFSETLLNSDTKNACRLDRYFYENNFAIIDEGVCMYLGLDKKVFQVSEHTILGTNSRLNEWITPLIDAFESTEEISNAYAEVHKKALQAGKRFYHYTLYVDEKPVSSITISIYNNIARIDDLGTHPSQQKRGFGSALLNFALSASQNLGAEHCFLCASKDRLHMYKKAGLVEIYEIKAYEKQKKSFGLSFLKTLGCWNQ